MRKGVPGVPMLLASQGSEKVSGPSVSDKLPFGYWGAGGKYALSYS